MTPTRTKPIEVDTKGMNEHAKKYLFLDNKHFVPKDDLPF